MRKIGARGCAACDNQSCPLRTAPRTKKKKQSDFKVETLSGNGKDPREKIL
jgi:predicted transcriptional regulator